MCIRDRAWPSPAEAARVPCNSSVQVAMASILTMDTDPEVRRNSRGAPKQATPTMGTATGHPVARPAITPPTAAHAAGNADSDQAGRTGRATAVGGPASTCDPIARHDQRTPTTPNPNSAPHAAASLVLTTGLRTSWPVWAGSRNGRAPAGSPGEAGTI